MNKNNVLHGLYLITNDDKFELLKHKINVALESSAIALLQYRRKNIHPQAQYAELEQLKKLCDQYQTPLIINDNLAMADHFQTGLHLGQGDGSLVSARETLGQQAIMGRTCHASLDLAQAASDDGANYLAFGAVYPSSTKPNAQLVSLDLLQQAKQQFDLPICAIGGLSAENSQPLVSAGVDLFAVVGDVFNLPVDQIAQRVQAWDRMIHGKC